MKSSLIILVALVGAFVAVQGATPKFGLEMVNFINSQADKTFTATQYSRFENLTLDGLKKFLSAVNTAPDLSKLNPGELASNETDKLAMATPANFDSATKWAKCKGVINGIQDQSNCGNCWAVSAAEVITDRRCIVYNAPKPRISAWDITTCCAQCMTGDGCGGGWPDEAFRWYVKTGVVTGDKYAGPGCQPYQVSPAGKLFASSSKCVKACKASYKAFTYPKDKHHGASVKVFNNQNAAVMAEIMARGPVVATFAVYEDFPGYRGGIYKHTTGKLAGYHAVKITGWGQTPAGLKYWKVANQWGTSWGEGGFFRIVRGGNNCGFEGGISTALPKKD